MGDVLATIVREPPPRLFHESPTAPLPRTAVELSRERARAALAATIPLLLFALTVAVRVLAPDLVPFGERQAAALAGARRGAEELGVASLLLAPSAWPPLTMAYPLLAAFPSPIEAWIAVRAILDGLAAVLVFLVGRSLAGTGVGIVAALLFGFSPWAWALSRDPAAPSLPVLSAATLLVTVRLVRSPGPTWGLAAGLLGGLLVRLDPVGWAVLAALALALVVGRVGWTAAVTIAPGLALTAGPVMAAWLTTGPGGAWSRVTESALAQAVVPSLRAFGDVAAGVGVERRMVGITELPAELGALAPLQSGAVALLLCVGAWRVVALARGGRRESLVPLVWTLVPAALVLVSGDPLRPELVHPLLPALAVLLALTGAPAGRWASRLRPVTLGLAAALAIAGGATVAALLWGAATVAQAPSTVSYAAWSAAGGSNADRPGSRDSPTASLQFWLSVADDVRGAAARTGQREVVVIGDERSATAPVILTSLLGGDVAVRPLPAATLMLPVERETAYLILPGHEPPPELAWPSARLGAVPLAPTDAWARVVTLRPRPVPHWLALHAGGDEVRFADGTVLLAARERTDPRGATLVELVWLTAPATALGTREVVVREVVEGSPAREVRSALPASSASAGAELVVQRLPLGATRTAGAARLSLQLISGAGQQVPASNVAANGDGEVEILRPR